MEHVLIPSGSPSSNVFYFCVRGVFKYNQKVLLYQELDVVGSKHVTGESSEHTIAAPPSLLGPSAAHIIANWLHIMAQIPGALSAVARRISVLSHR